MEKPSITSMDPAPKAVRTNQKAVQRPGPIECQSSIDTLEVPVELHQRLFV